MQKKDFDYVSDLISDREELVTALRFTGLCEGIQEKPSAFSSGNFKAYYEKFLKKELNDEIVQMARGCLISKISEVEREIIKFIPDFEKYSIGD